MRWTDDDKGVQVPPSKWSLQAIVAISRLPGNEPIDLSRRGMARNIVRYCEIDDPEFPCPEVFRDGVGYIHLLWKADDSLGPRTLEFQVSRPNSFRGVIWRQGVKGKVGDVDIAATDHVERARKLFGAFWPGGNAWGMGEMLDLLRVKR